MCLATNVKIIKIKEDWATVEEGGRSYKVNISLVKDAKIGDYILAHGDLAVNKLPESDALEILKIIEEHPHDHCHCDK